MYCIEKIGYGKNTRYAIKQKVHDGLYWPTDGKAYRTLEKAIAVAKEKGYNIVAIGDIWEI